MKTSSLRDDPVFLALGQSIIDIGSKYAGYPRKARKALGRVIGRDLVNKRGGASLERRSVDRTLPTGWPLLKEIQGLSNAVNFGNGAGSFHSNADRQSKLQSVHALPPGNPPAEVNIRLNPGACKCLFLMGKAA